jgi:NAD(P)-dependent dehydrogenase (short-subunit alcohol dehydrogenase family)
MQTSVIPSESVKGADMPFSLEGKTAIVTGSGRGIGRAIARRLVAAGACVMLNDLDEKMLNESRESLPDPERVDVVAAT